MAARDNLEEKLPVKKKKYNKYIFSLGLCQRVGGEPERKRLDKKGEVRTK